MNLRSLATLLAVELLAAFLMSAAPPDLWALREVRSVQAHILGAERLAAGRDVSRLAPEIRERRARLLHLLRGYRERGEFPRNRDFADRRMPYFIDAGGVRCAMAYLIESTGANQLVRRIARTRNNAFVRELASDPELGAWLARNGLTLAEAARIQPTYGYRPTPTSGNGDATVFGVVYATEAAGVIMNLHIAPPRSRGPCGVFGVLVGFTGVMLGTLWVANGPHDTHDVALGATSMVLGMTSLALGERQLMATRPKSVESQVTPLMWRDENGMGLGLSVSF